LSPAPDVAVVGGGIVGCAAAARLAGQGASVELYERDELAGAASGRNQGSVQHPFDPVLAPLHDETLAIYRAIEGFELPAAPVGVLMVSRDSAAVARPAAELARELPELEATLVEGEELAELEPALAPGLAACRLETGRPVRPASATLALAALARERGATLHEGAEAVLELSAGRVAGVRAGGEVRPAGAVLVAAGPWTPEVVDPTGGWRPIEPVWGALAEVELDDPPRHVLEEAGVEAVGTGGVDSIFSLVSGEGGAAVGSTFSAVRPDPGEVARRLCRSGAAFVPALAAAELVASRACARPQSFDGRPLIGPVPGVEGLHVAAGHGPWGISAGPASARLAADALLGRAEVRPELAAGRFGADRFGVDRFGAARFGAAAARPRDPSADL
jgi:glycine/D-amino acid oxidase-like deaminating enzyme